MRGVTSVFSKEEKNPRYSFNRGFSGIGPNHLILSNDGEVILYIIPNYAEDDVEGLKSVTIYKNGQIYKSYTTAEITGCDPNEERCELEYFDLNALSLIDEEKSKYGTKEFHLVFKEHAPELDKFLYQYSVFSDNDIVYLVDSKKQIHYFDLKKCEHVGSDPLDKVFDQIIDKGRQTKTEKLTFSTDVFKLKKLGSGESAVVALEKILGLIETDFSEDTKGKIRVYTFIVEATILRNGHLKNIKLDFRDKMPEEKIRAFFEKNLFDTSNIPEQFKEWDYKEVYRFKNENERIGKKERKKEIKEEKEAYILLCKKENIDGIYIPKNLEDCFYQLDKILKDIDKKEIKEVKNKLELIGRYHFGIGMWMRNNWGLWGGSRLQKYFLDRGVMHPDDMSSIILDYYFDWLKGDKETWKEWEKHTHP